MGNSLSYNNFKGQSREGQKRFDSMSGQIVVEYILLVAVAVTLAILISSALVSRNSESPGFLVAKWQQILQTIGADKSD